MRSHLLMLALGSLLLVLLVGCKDEKKVGTAAAAAPDTPYPRKVATALSEAGIKAGELEQAAAKPYAAADCARGQVDKLDLLVCDYKDEATARQGEKKLERFVAGAVSGGIRRRGSRVLAVADRDKVDLKGETINKTLKAFAGKK